MAGTELIIDDDYVNEMADFLNTRATNLQEGIDRYIQILDNIRMCGLFAYRSKQRGPCS